MAVMGWLSRSRISDGGCPSRVGGSPRRPAQEIRTHFTAYFAPLSAKTRPIRLAIRAKPPDSAAISRKRGTKTPI
jgi:hypothetical protein